VTIDHRLPKKCLLKVWYQGPGTLFKNGDGWRPPTVYPQRCNFLKGFNYHGGGT
jgi:hypothetical protein